MLKYINLKKLTSNTLIGILLATGLIAESSDRKALANSCGNNGHGNNAPMTIALSTGNLTIGHYDPSNESDTQKNRLISDLDNGLFGSSLHTNRQYYINFTGTSYDLSNEGLTGQQVVNSLPDWEIHGTTTILECDCNDRDGDGINDAIELGSDFNNPVDTDGDGIYDYEDTDSDGDGIDDSVEGTADSDSDGLANYLDDTDDTTSSTSPDTATDPAPESITLTGTIRDFKDNHPDFQYKIGNDRGIVTTELGADKKPIYAHGAEGTKTTNGPDNFNQWYRNVPGINKSIEHSIELTRQSDGTYQYSNNQFFPINGKLWGNYKNNKNYHFTYELHTSFTYKGGETFTFSGDDDVWVYIDGKRVIDIGGVHTSQTQSVNLDSLGLTVGETYDLDFFFAERHYSQSNFTITTSIQLETATNPDADDDGDGISNLLEDFENETDSDGDGTPDYQDEDSDDNGIPDSIEVGTPSSPSDSDGDSIPNFQDDDDDGNGIDDIDEIGDEVGSDGVPIPTNTDGQDLPDYQDTDDDNDGIDDVDDGLEDSTLDDDTIPNYHDTDSDGDTIPDSVEGGDDSDLDDDTDPNFLDHDSDGDTIPDSVEGGDDSDLDDDTDPNFLDHDSDGDGIDDQEEDIADSNDQDEETDVEDDDLADDGTIEDVDGDGNDNYLDTDSDDDGFEDDEDPNPYIKDYAD